MTEKEAAAREAIRATLMRYTWGGDNGVFDDFVNAFAEDGVLEIKGTGSFQGRVTIRYGGMNGFGSTEEKRQRIRDAGRFSHHLSSTRIELVDDTNAKSWSYFAVFGKLGPDHWGRYTDTLKKIGDQWLLVHRRVSTDAAMPHSAFYPDGVV
jgi:hypothetical protein